MPRASMTKSRPDMRLAGLIVFLGLVLVCTAQSPDYLVMEFVWDPIICSPPEPTCINPPIKAFIVYELRLISIGTPKQEYNCPTTVTNATDVILPQNERQLNCIFSDHSVPGGASNAVLWNSNWESTGSCTGLTTTEYFRAMTEIYDKYNPNPIMKKYGIAPPTVDRDGFLLQLQQHYGKKAWIECDTATRNLKKVSVCLAVGYPYEQRDCPFDPLNPGATSNGLVCQGTLNLPTSTMPAVVTTPAECVQYIKPYDVDPITGSPPPPPPAGSPPAPVSPPVPPFSVPPPPPPDDSGSNAGAIVGGVIGGLALVALVAAGIIFMRRKRSRDRGPPEDTPSAAAANGNGNGLPPYTYSSTPPTGYIAVGGAATALATSSGSYPPTTPASELNRLSFRPSGAGAAAMATDPLMAYITSTLSTQTSRGSLKSWELLFEDITVERPIGEGSWGRVYKGTYHQTQVAVKVLLDNTSGSGAGTQSTLVSTNGTVMARLEQEAALMSNLHHPNIVHLLGVCIYPAAIVTEYCARGSLTDVLSAGRASPECAAELTWSRRISMAADCCRGMLYLHSRRPPIIHRDLKSANLLVTASWKLKVSDFNLSKIMEDTTRSTSLQAMNPRWLSPEVLGGAAATLASDVFAMGVIFWELLTWELPWGTANPWGIVNQINAGNRLPMPPSAALPGPGSGGWDKLDAYLALMNRCWAQRPEDRPTFEQIMGDLRALDSAAVEAVDI